jgi:CubicO group peptidase (beta-lactamase class C family)
MFVDRGIFNWTSRLSEVLPSYIVEKMHPGHKYTTIEMLLLHISGIYSLESNTDPLWMDLYNTTLAPEHGRKLCAELVLSKPPVSVPGENYTYNNTGYMLVGHILET